MRVPMKTLSKHLLLSNKNGKKVRIAPTQLIGDLPMIITVQVTVTLAILAIQVEASINPSPNKFLKIRSDQPMLIPLSPTMLVAALEPMVAVMLDMILKTELKKLSKTARPILSRTHPQSTRIGNLIPIFRTI